MFRPQIIKGRSQGGAKKQQPAKAKKEVKSMKKLAMKKQKCSVTITHGFGGILQSNLKKCSEWLISGYPIKPISAKMTKSVGYSNTTKE